MKTNLTWVWAFLVCLGKLLKELYMDYSVQARMVDYRSNPAHCVELNNNCMAVQETKGLVSEQTKKVAHHTFSFAISPLLLTIYASLAIVSSKICNSEDTGLGSLQRKKH